MTGQMSNFRKMNNFPHLHEHISHNMLVTYNFNQRVPRSVLNKKVPLPFMDEIFVTHNIPEGNSVALTVKIA